MKTGINFIVRFLKDWTLPCAMLAGVTSYLCFSRIEEFFVLKPYLYALSSFLTPVLIFMMLFFTFCKVNPRDLRPRLWHFWLLALQVLACVGTALWIVKSGMSGESLLIWEGTLACLLCPTATAAAVITGKLGGNSGSLTTYTLESNILSAILITLICPWVHPHADLSWTAALFVILSKVTYLLICPFLAALLVRYLLPSLHVRLVALRDVAFYLWAVSLAMVMAQTTHIVLTSSARPFLEWEIALAALLVCGLKFAFGKLLGNCYGERISGGQALGQKNTVFAIWMAMTYLSPLAAIGPGSYVVWQNTVNSWQLWRKRRNDAQTVS